LAAGLADVDGLAASFAGLLSDFDSELDSPFDSPFDSLLEALLAAVSEPPSLEPDALAAASESPWREGVPALL